MAAGCPVIVTPDVGIASVVQEEGCGIVVAGDPVNLGIEIKRLLSDHDCRRDMGNAGRRAVQTKYSWKTIGREMLDVYRGILADRDATSMNMRATTTPSAAL
jgi:glycosyltransferase involved in cell wall biosynthesis